MIGGHCSPGNRRGWDGVTISRTCSLSSSGANDPRARELVGPSSSTANGWPRRFLDPRVIALVLFRLRPEGFTARDLHQHVAPLLGLAPDALAAGRVTYDLRWLRLH